MKRKGWQLEVAGGGRMFTGIGRGYVVREWGEGKLLEFHTTSE